MRIGMSFGSGSDSEYDECHLTSAVFLATEEASSWKLHLTTDVWEEKNNSDDDVKISREWKHNKIVRGITQEKQGKFSA